ncbi:cupin domain-containing protein [Streptosporangium algeriense]|uniref:Cupin domain-containing protein n=1 Tax=Streptosporangium algeriense TaxID=1682748 RepID=A0ABW3DK95_9ACTN
MEPVRIAYDVEDVQPSGAAIEVIRLGENDVTVSWPFKASRFHVPAGVTSERDVHDVVEVWMVRSGRGVVVSGDTRTELSPGDMVFFPSRVEHQVTAVGAEDLKIFSIWWQGTRG